MAPGSNGNATETVRGDETFRRRLELLDVTGDIHRHLDFPTVARRTVEAVVSLTEFQVATLTLREGRECRRVATAGLEEGRIGMTTPYASWEQLLQDEWRVGTASFLIPPEAPAQWADVPDLPQSDEPDAWTAEHGLVIPLCDAGGETVGFLSVDQPESRSLPDDTTLETLELFARQAQTALVNARLYELTRRQADTMANLFEVAKAMATTMDLEVVIPRILSAVNRRLSPYVTALVRRQGEMLDVARTDRVTGDMIVRRARRADGPLGELTRRIDAGEQLIELTDVDEFPDLAGRLTAGTRSLCAVARKDIGGEDVVLVVTSDRDHAFDEDDKRFLEGALDCAVAAIRNAELYEEARFAAERDALTGLRNRRVFWTTVAAEVERATRDHPLALAVIDIDNFKAVNDELGHESGDRALVHVANRLEAKVRETDAVFRIGGEEFVLVMPDTHAEDARTVLRRISDAIKTSRMDLPPLTISAGIAMSPHDADTADALVNAADAALYSAKRAGKDRVDVAAAPDDSRQ